MSAHDSTIRTLMVSTSYPSGESDWKGLFIRRLAEALCRHASIELRLWNPPGPVPEGAILDATPTEADWLAHLMSAGGIAHLLRSRSADSLTAPARLLLFLRKVYARNSDVDVYHVNWLQNAIALPNNGRPALLTVLGTDLQLLRLPLVKALIRRALRHRAAAICPNADWMVPTLESMFGDIATVRHVPFGIDPRWYAVERRLASGLPPRWLVVSRLTRAKLGPLFDYCGPLFEKGGRELHLFGPMQDQIALPGWVHYHGAATPDQLCRDWFPTAHGMITLSRHAEGRPQVMLEAMAAGLPIVASRLQAHEDLLLHRDTGWLCEDEAGLLEGLSMLEDNDRNLAMGLRSRAWAAGEIGTWDDCALRYVDLYRSLAGRDTA